jgi:hypothetical protein
MPNSYFSPKKRARFIQDRKAKATFLRNVAFETRPFCAYKGVWVSPNLMLLILDTFDPFNAQIYDLFLIPQNFFAIFFSF